MSRFERAKTASFQAARYIDYPVTEATISLARLGDSQRWALGIARRASMKARLTAARQAKLIPLAVDDNALALARVYGDFDGSIDISAERTHITVFAKPIPWTAHVAVGGTSLTEGIARSLGIDAATAEERKRAIGFAGAGEVQRDALIDAIDEALANARASGLTNRRRFVLVGNGSRIPGLAEAIERATGYDVRTGSLTGEISDTLPADVLRAASVDWSIAFGLSVWQLAS
jgi:Tfp pilus assembly PilM family ATPase